MSDDTEHGLDPSFFEIRPFVLHDETGRITATGTQGRGGTEMMASQGALTFVAEATLETDYVDLSGETPVVKPRPVWTPTPAKTVIAPREETTIPDVPACKLTFEGPLKGTHGHAGGDLAVGFTVPGTYTLTFEAFPLMDASLTLTVAA